MVSQYGLCTNGMLRSLSRGGRMRVGPASTFLPHGYLMRWFLIKVCAPMGCCAPCQDKRRRTRTPISTYIIMHHVKYWFFLIGCAPQLSYYALLISSRHLDLGESSFSNNTAGWEVSVKTITLKRKLFRHKEKYTRMCKTQVRNNIS